MATLEIRDLHVSVEDKQILAGVNLISTTSMDEGVKTVIERAKEGAAR